MSSIKITGDPQAWADAEKRRQDAAMAEVAIDIMRIAQMNAPKDSGALVRSGRVNRAGSEWVVTFGDNSVRYARRRHYENKKSPQTLKYLERAGESVAKGNPTKYFRGN